MVASVGALAMTTISEAGAGHGGEQAERASVIGEVAHHRGAVPDNAQAAQQPEHAVGGDADDEQRDVDDGHSQQVRADRDDAGGHHGREA
jgi:hypothetical protein